MSLLMTNGPRLPIILDMACLSGNFAEPQYTGIEAKMLEWTQGGSVAGWGATGFGVATGHDWLHRGFYRRSSRMGSDRWAWRPLPQGIPVELRSPSR